MSEPILWLTDRSRMVAYRNCPRLRYLRYHAEGSGLERKAASLPLVTGQAVHTALAQILRGDAPEDAIVSAWTQYMDEVTSRGVQASGIHDAFLAEQRALLEGLVWAWNRVRLPAIRAEYDLVSVERDMLWTMGTQDGVTVVDMVKCDALVRRRSDGTLFYLEFKTTTQGGDEWIKQWEHNSQLLINTVAVEELLGERLGGVLIEGLLKGRRAPERLRHSPFRGRVLQQSALCYAYAQTDSLGGRHYSLDYVSPKWERIAVWTEVDARRWTHDVMTTEQCAALFVPCPPIRPRNELLARHRAQMLHQESAIARMLPSADLDRDFPMNDDHCYRYWGNPCEMEELCFNAAIAQDPLGSGLYQRRRPHHELEGRGAPDSAEPETPDRAGH